MARLRIALYHEKMMAVLLKGRIIAGSGHSGLFEDEFGLLKRWKWFDLSAAKCLQCKMVYFSVASLSITVNTKIKSSSRLCSFDADLCSKATTNAAPEGFQDEATFIDIRT